MNLKDLRRQKYKNKQKWKMCFFTKKKSYELKMRFPERLISGSVVPLLEVIHDMRVFTKQNNF
jgi:hypothetical protein